MASSAPLTHHTASRQASSTPLLISLVVSLLASSPPTQSSAINIPSTSPARITHRPCYVLTCVAPITLHALHLARSPCALIRRQSSRSFDVLDSPEHTLDSGALRVLSKRPMASQTLARRRRRRLNAIFFSFTNCRNRCGGTRKQGDPRPRSGRITAGRIIGMAVVSGVHVDLESDGFAFIDYARPVVDGSVGQRQDAHRDVGMGGSPNSGPATGARMDVLNDLVSLVLNVFPDMNEDHAITRLRYFHLEQNVHFDELAQTVCEEVFEGDGDYPRIPVKGKRKATNGPLADAKDEAGTAPGPPQRNFYRTEGQPEPHRAYRTAAGTLLRAEFPSYPLPECGRIVSEAGGFFAPARRRLPLMSQEAEAEDLTEPRTAKRRKLGEEPLQNELQRRSTELVLQKLNGLRTFVIAPDTLRDEVLWVYSEEGEACLAQDMLLPPTGIECGCCFDDQIPFEHFIQCRDGHLFCKTCAQRYAEERIGIRSADLKCMYGDGCEAGFAKSEIQRFLPKKTYELLVRLSQEVSVQRAEIENLEVCPFCSYACVMENPDEKLFRCLNQECEKSSCRACKAEDHLPFTCKEAEAKEQGDDGTRKRRNAENALRRP
ncbi:hypothetical protein ACQY0O_005910 [Thecaphora frezii]